MFYIWSLTAQYGNKLAVWWWEGERLWWKLWYANLGSGWEGGDGTAVHERPPDFLRFPFVVNSIRAVTASAEVMMWSNLAETSFGFNTSRFLAAPVAPCLIPIFGKSLLNLKIKSDSIRFLTVIKNMTRIGTWTIAVSMTPKCVCDTQQTPTDSSVLHSFQNEDDPF